MAFLCFFFKRGPHVLTDHVAYREDLQDFRQLINCCVDIIHRFIAQLTMNPSCVHYSSDSTVGTPLEKPWWW